MTERLSHKRDCLYKDKITCSKSHLFVLEKADYTYKHTVIRQARQPTHLPVICSIPSSLRRRIITRKYAQGNHFHNVLCLSEAKGMDINMKRLKGRLGILAVVMMLVCVLCVGILGVKVYASETYNVHSNINTMMEEINTMIENSDETMMSSNPYDYIDNQYFDNLINGGISMLPAITDQIASSESNGLREYILAIAAEEISKTYLNQENVYNWSNGKEWLDEWHIYLRNIPTKVEYIINDIEHTIEDKETALNNIGIMCLPYIKDAIDAGHTEYQDIYNSLMGVSEINSRTSVSNNLNESDLDVIRNMVEDVRVD